MCCFFLWILWPPLSLIPVSRFGIDDGQPRRTCVLSSIQLFAFYHSISGWNCIRVIDNKQSNEPNERWSFFCPLRICSCRCSRKMAFHVPSLLFCVHQCFLSIINFFLPFSSFPLLFSFFQSPTYFLCAVCSFDIVFYVLAKWTLSSSAADIANCSYASCCSIHSYTCQIRFNFFLCCPFVWSETHYTAEAKSE